MVIRSPWTFLFLIDELLSMQFPFSQVSDVLHGPVGLYDVYAMRDKPSPGFFGLAFQDGQVIVVAAAGVGHRAFTQSLPPCFFSRAGFWMRLMLSWLKTSSMA